MKNLITLLFISASLCTTAQTLQVNYTETLDISEKLKSITNPAIKQMIIAKTGQPKQFLLTSSNGISSYKELENTNAATGNNAVTMIGSGTNDIIYKNLQTKTFAKQTEFMSRTFLIEDKLNTTAWNITEESLQIGNYLCKKATLKKGNKAITAWFTNSIASNEGPRKYYGLPGLILKLTTGNVIIEATTINVTKEKTTISKPTRGKKINQLAFDSMRKEKINRLTGGKTNDNGVQVIKM